MITKTELLVILLVVGIAFIQGCAEQGKEDLRDKNILMVIAPEGFRDEELFDSKRIFEERGAKVEIASIDRNIAKGMLGGAVKPDLVFDEVDIDEYDGIVIVGGIGSKKYLWNDEELISLVREAYYGDKVVSAICLSPVILARAGILEEKESTVFPDPEAIEELERHGAKYVDRDVVVSGRIITGKDPKSVRNFALEVCHALSDHVPE
ncbi:MAG: DJ-1/PfpI family protein [Candidatus Syntropharchaeia archaeon]